MHQPDDLLTTSTSDMIIRSREPLNAEPRLRRLRESFITPQHQFYIRSHGDIPRLDPGRYRLRVGGLVATPLDLSLDALRTRFTACSVQAVLQCAGNRRADLQPVRPTTGDPWQSGAIGHAEWTGARLADVLHAAGARTDAALHVAFTACDLMPPKGGSDGDTAAQYEVSIPMEKALGDEVLLAWAMNHAALTPSHGFPVRVVVPGYAGVRSVKWVTAVTVRNTASDSAVQQRDYKLLPPHANEATVDWDAGLTINEMPLNAAICDPEPGAVVPVGPLMVRGYAIVTGRRIARVDVSSDGGETWLQATIEPDRGGPWSWTFWHAAVPLPPGAHELAVRAWDTAGQTMPARPDDVWNFKGYLCAAWHRVPVVARARSFGQ